MPFRLIVAFLIALSAAMVSVRTLSGHEHEHTHAGLTSAMFQLLEIYWDRENLNPNQRPMVQDVFATRQGAIDEDDCPRYYSHFYNPNTPTLAGSNVEPGDFIDNNCSWTDNPANVGKIGAEQYFVQALATDRAGELWVCALQTYRGQNCTEPTLQITHPAGRATAFGLLGQVLHLLEDMTSPAHVHNDPHGKPGLQGFGDCRGQDADDFENWGWCISRGSPLPDADHGHITDYVVHPAAQPEQMTPKLLTNLQTLYAQSPQGTPGSSDPVFRRFGENRGEAFVRHLAELVYSFTTFKVDLEDTTGGTDVQPDSELRRMLRGSTNGPGGNNCGAFTIDTGLCDVSGGWTISGSLQEVGFSNGYCGRAEWGLDTNEEWWLMEHGNMGSCSYDSSGNDIIANGFAYIENTGGEGPAGFVSPDSFVPEQYGCSVGDEATCGGAHKSKELFRRLYGTNDNNGKTMLRIYGDTLYATAVAYGAGLIHTFIEEVNKPTADPGGFYTGEACQAITLDASGSTDQGTGSIVSYAWDFTADGVFDQTVAGPITQHTYMQPFSGEILLRVTDNDEFTDEGRTEVEVTPDVTPPNLSTLSATPSVLWPPNHDMIDVVLNANASDACGVGVCRIVSVTSNEVTTNSRVARGHTDPDIEITGNLTLRLRAEKNGEGASRVYRATVQCTDVNGNSASKTVDVVVPHSQSGKSK